MEDEDLQTTLSQYSVSWCYNSIRGQGVCRHVLIWILVRLKWIAPQGSVIKSVDKSQTCTFHTTCVSIYWVFKQTLSWNNFRWSCWLEVNIVLAHGRRPFITWTNTEKLFETSNHFVSAAEIYIVTNILHQADFLAALKRRLTIKN